MENQNQTQQSAWQRFLHNTMFGRFLNRNFDFSFRTAANGSNLGGGYPQTS